jgi:hypothetical protein
MGAGDRGSQGFDVYHRDQSGGGDDGDMSVTQAVAQMKKSAGEERFQCNGYSACGDGKKDKFRAH